MSTRPRATVALAVLAVLAALLVSATAPAAELVADTVWIPLTETPLIGAPRELRLETFLYRPASPGPYPVLVFNHGSTGAGRVSPKATDPYRYPEVARFFVERGWAVVIAMRRGRGASGGEYLELYDCNRGALASGVDRGIADVDAVLAWVSAQPWADTSRLLLGGMSRGGFLSVLYPSRHRTTARGVVNFAGGWMVERCDRAVRINTDTFVEAGRGGSLPMLWLYAENDRNYGPGAIRSYHDAFTQAGGRAELRLYPPIGHDGHILLPGAADVWSATVQDFLVRLGLGPP